MENPIKMDDLGVPLLLETPIYFQLFSYHYIMQLGISEMREPGQIWKSKTFRQRKTSDLGNKFGSKCGIDNVLVPAGKDDEMQISN